MVYDGHRGFHGERPDCLDHQRRGHARRGQHLPRPRVEEDGEAALRLERVHRAREVVRGAGTITGTLLWGAATWALSPGASQRSLPEVSVHSESDGAMQPLPTLGRGQLRVINLWASWCGPCRQEMPIFAALQGTEADVQFLFINQGESVQDVRAYLQSAKLSLQGVWLDPSSALGPAVGVAGLPATLFVNAQGQIVELHFGVLSEPALKARLRALREAP